jgi:hypothetical protein
MLARANTDLVMMTALVGVAMLTRSRRAYLAAPVIGLSAGLKLYPAGALIALRGWHRLLACGFSGVAVLGLTGPYLSKIRESTPSGTYTTFGAGVMPAAIRHGWPGTVLVSLHDQAVGLAVIVALTLVTLIVRRTRTKIQGVATSLRTNEAARTAFLVGAGTFLTTYMFTTSFDYRLFSLAFIAVGCLLVQDDGRPQRVLLWLVLAGLWLSYPMKSGYQLVGDALMVATVVFISSVTLCLLVVRPLPSR